MSKKNELDLSKDPLVIRCYKALRDGRPPTPQRLGGRPPVQWQDPDEPVSNTVSSVSYGGGRMYYVDGDGASTWSTTDSSNTRD